MAERSIEMAKLGRGGMGEGRLQKSVARPPYVHSFSYLSGSFLGPPISPVSGLVSPSNSGRGFLRASGCMSPFSGSDARNGDASVVRE